MYEHFRFISEEKKNEKHSRASPSGNRTPVSRVTGGDTHHYTNEELHGGWFSGRPLIPFYPAPPLPFATTSRPDILLLLLQLPSKLNGTKMEAFSLISPPHLFPSAYPSSNFYSLPFPPPPLPPPSGAISTHRCPPQHTLPESKAHALSRCTTGLVVPSVPYRTLLRL